LAQAYQRDHPQHNCTTPDLDNPQRLIDFFALITELRRHQEILAYHDRSDGGAIVALLEMAFAARCGLRCELAAGDELLPTLFSEAPGVLVQLSEGGVERMHAFIAQHKETLHKETLSVKQLARINKTAPHEVSQKGPCFQIHHNGQSWQWDLLQLKRVWCETSARIQAQRDDPQCAAEELESACDASNPGLSAEWNFNVAEGSNDALTAHSPTRHINTRKGNTRNNNTRKGKKPKVAILREQGINGHHEMAAAFERAGFAAYDVHSNDLLHGTRTLAGFAGLVACGGFSYGDVLGAGAGWASSILLHERTREDFEAFFNRPNTFTLGVCNGCQMLARIKEIIPGAAHWPTFERNRSQQFEARLVRVAITPSPSVLLAEMDGARLPIVVAHGEGRAVLADEQTLARVAPYTCLRYIDNHNRSTEHYPENPNGSRHGLTAFCSTDGRATIMMPHPERLFRTVQYSWHDFSWGEMGPWFKLFQNAYRFSNQ